MELWQDMSRVCTDNVEGKVLVASPNMDDPTFNRSLIYMCIHDEGGAVGVILNQPLGTLTAEEVFQGHIIGDMALPVGLKKKSYPILFGGMVNADMIVALSVTKQQEINFGSDSGRSKANLHIDATNFIKEMVSGKTKASKCLFARGICAWDSNHLEQELMNNDWLVAEADISTIFSQKKKDKWSDIMISQFGIKNVNSVVSYSVSA